MGADALRVKHAAGAPRKEANGASDEAAEVALGGYCLARAFTNLSSLPLFVGDRVRRGH